MSVRATQAKALQQLQALNLQHLSARQILAAAAESLSAMGREKSAGNLSCPQCHMTTGQPPQYQVQQQAMGSSIDHQQHRRKASSHEGSKKGAGFATPSPTSSMSDCCQLDRPHLPSAAASTKSAKRKAAEALLAARYSGIAFAAAVTLPAAAAAAAACTQLQNKRHRSNLTSVIDKLEGTINAAPGAQQSSTQTWNVAASAAAAASSTGQLQKPQLAKLQQELQRLHGQHQQVLMHQQQQHQQQQAQGQQQHQRDPLQEELTAAAAAGSSAGRHSSSASVQQQQQQQYVQVPSCAPNCAHDHAQGWCHSEVRIPHVDWGRVLDSDLASAPSIRLASGYERLTLPGGLQVLLVENPAYLQNALQQLRTSMADSIIAIDLEWRPEFGRRFTPVAMMQLASSKMAVLIRTCRMNYRLPAVLKDFLADPKVLLVGFSWASSDEPKMQSTFGVGSRNFGRFLDLQQVAEGLGYSSFGLARLTKHVLGLHMPKSKKVSMSNWEAANLTRSQVKYAALDVLVAGQVFRALRLWHSSPSLCEVCHYKLGTVTDSTSYSCSCGKKFHEIKGYLQHCATSNHEPRWAECSGCGCARRLPWPSGAQAGGSSDATGSNSSASLASEEEDSEG